MSWGRRKEQLQLRWRLVRMSDSELVQLLQLKQLAVNPCRVTSNWAGVATDCLCPSHQLSRRTA